MAKMELDVAKMVKETFEKHFGVTLDRLRELAEADKDGRCVVLPCKVGDTVYILRGDAHNGYETVKKTHAEKVAGGFTIWMLNGNTMKMNDFYYLTRSEAEAALANIQQTNDQTVSKLASSKSVPSQFQVSSKFDGEEQK